MNALSKWLLIGVGLVLVSTSVRMITLHFEAERARRNFPVREDCTRLESSLDFYKEKFGSYPSEPNGLMKLLADIECRGLLKNTNLVDPWGTPFKYQIIEGSPRVESAGSDKKFDTLDDIRSIHSSN